MRREFRSGRSRAILVVCALLASGSRTVDARQFDLRYTIDGLERRVELHAPARKTETPTLLIVVYHGRGDDASKFGRAVKLHRDWPEAIVAYPRGELHANSVQRGWQYRAGQYDDRDLKLTDALLADLAERYGTRPESTYAAGFSNGGHFVFLLTQERPDAFAAHAVIGSVHPKFGHEAPPRPMLYLFGTGEDAEHRDAWAGTVQALIAHQRTRGELEDWMGCCKRRAAAEGGAVLVFGTYNAGHIWPNRGNEWLRAFFTEVPKP